MAAQNHHDTTHTLDEYQENTEHLLLANSDYSEGPGGDQGANRHLRKLTFRNPGRFMEDFDPERSTREMRKMNRRIYCEARKKQAYDERGFLMTDGRDVCDCLDSSCPGCHFSCPKCISPKCGGDCRANRRWVYQEVEIEGTNQKVRFPDPPKPYS